MAEVSRKEALEALERILNYCEEKETQVTSIDQGVYTYPPSGYRMLPDYFIVKSYIVDHEWDIKKYTGSDGRLYQYWVCRTCGYKTFIEPKGICRNCGGADYEEEEE